MLYLWNDVHTSRWRSIQEQKWHSELQNNCDYTFDTLKANVLLLEAFEINTVRRWEHQMIQWMWYDNQRCQLSGKGLWFMQICITLQSWGNGGAHFRSIDKITDIPYQVISPCWPILQRQQFKNFFNFYCNRYSSDRSLCINFKVHLANGIRFGLKMTEPFPMCKVACTIQWSAFRVCWCNVARGVWNLNARQVTNSLDALPFLFSYVARPSGFIHTLSDIFSSAKLKHATFISSLSLIRTQAGG